MLDFTPRVSFLANAQADPVKCHARAVFEECDVGKWNLAVTNRDGIELDVPTK